MLAGHPGLGKSQLALTVAAIVTRGGHWPANGGHAECGSAVILSAEDDPADTMRPRLEAAGADLTRCHVIEATQETDNSGKSRQRGFSLTEDIPRLDAFVRQLSDVRIVIIDPLTAYLGKIDSHHNAEVRAVLAPLAGFAATYGVAVVAVSHLRKTLAGDAVLQVTGSLAFSAAARAVYIVIRDHEDPARRLLLTAKNNLANDQTGYAYRVEDTSLANGIETSRIAWEPDAVTITADEAMAAHDRTEGNPPAKREGASRWLAVMPAEGRVAVSTLQAEAKGAGYSWATVRRAADALGVTTEKADFSGGWAWRLPEEATPGAEIEV
jgi:hypothetical protein